MTTAELIALQRAHKQAQSDTTVAYRLKKLNQLRSALKGPWKERLEQALWEDFNKNGAEVNLTELLPTLDNIKIIRQNLKRWLAPQKVKTPLPLLGSTSYTRAEAKGNTLVIAPWNYPIFLSLVLGGVPEATELLTQRFDHIFFTGSTHVGQIVMEAASKFLTPVTLELGGKSPTIVDASANGYEAGKRVAWAKFTNAGQICIAPDHVYVHQSQLEAFRKGVKEAVKRHYGDDPTQHPDFVQIVNPRNFDRLNNILEDSKTEAGIVDMGGTANAEARKIAPTMVVDPPRNGALMREELFGPLLPVFSYTDVNEPLKEIGTREHPLVVYIYAKSRKNINYIQRQTRAGATAVNMSLLQIANNFLPFGGVGHSGMGKTNGHAGFLEFTNTRSQFYQWGPPINNFIATHTSSTKI
ncbi:MAG: aldehyde dehydrogenase family protein [Flavobacteriia bacterium]|nr:aldehyde dehydrogenase family protein [Flavobacteriia bacterium]